MKTLYRILGFLFLIGYWLVLPFVISGCGTVVPTTVPSASASFDGNDQNSGIVAARPDGFAVTPHFRDRYNALIARYGRDFAVPLRVDGGLTHNGQWIIDRQHLAKFLEMSAWSRAGLQPIKP